MSKRIRYVDKNKDHLEHITHLGTAHSRYTKRGIVRRIEKDGKTYYTEEGGKRADLEVVIPAKGEKYVRTQRDSVTIDNLLSLPSCPSTLKEKKD
jgi:hypothetical protein